MIRVGVTGGIGSGKSTVCRLFAERGVPVYDSDSEAKRLMGEDPSLRAALVEAFGDETFRDGVLNRRYLAATVFGDRRALARLEALVHPCVKRDFERWAAERTAEPYVVLECAILYESGMDAAVDRVVAVVAPEELRLVRVNARDGASAAEIRRRMAAQLSDDVLSARADYIIVNINREDLAADVAECDRRFRYEEINLDFSRRQVMTIVNVTPDSFFAGSRTPDWLDVERRVREAVEAGASVIDVGGYSSRSGADEVSPEEEWRRVDLGVGAVRSLSSDLPVSIDTFRSSVAARAIHKYGKVIINDISAGELDPLIVDVAAEHDVPYVAMHMKGDPRTMQSMTDYRDIVAEVVDYFRERTAQLRERGVRRIVVDPGFGFAKTLEQNYELLRGLHRLAELGYPVLAGVSRKSMIYKLLGTTPAEALNGTTALHWECLRQGAVILRAHDTREAVEVVRMFDQFMQA